MHMLVVGAGVIGTVYGAQIAAAGHSVAILTHGDRTDEVDANGLVVHDNVSGTKLTSPVTVVATVSSARYDLVFVAVRYDQVKSMEGVLANLAGQPTVLYFGNQPPGRPRLPANLGGEIRLGFPGIGGRFAGGVVEYARIAQQPTVLEAAPSPVLDVLDQALRSREFKTQRVSDVDGWLAYHAVFIASIAAALYRCDTDPGRLARDPQTLLLMCRAISEGFACLRRQGVGGSPAALAFLQRALLRPIAVAYWAHMLRSPMGELCFAAHARHAPGEMRALETEAVRRVGEGAPHLRELLEL